MEGHQSSEPLHHNQQPHQPPPQPLSHNPPTGSHNSSSSNSSSSNSFIKNKRSNSSELKTLYISGLPLDVKEREIHNLFRFFPGYEGCNLVENNKEDNVKQYVAFAVFVDRASAVYALTMLKDLRFDPVSPQSMRVEFAKSNTKYSYLSTPGELFMPEKKKGLPTPMDHNFFPKMAYNPYLNNYAVNPMYPLQQSLVALPPSNVITSPRAKKPSSTLYVADFHPVVTERDLTRLFETQPGFQKLVMSKIGLPFCFVYYDDIQSSTKAMQAFQGFLIGPSHLRIEYAREKKQQRTPKDDSNENELKPT